MSSSTTTLVETGMTPVKQPRCSLLVKIIIGVTVSAVVVAGAASAGYFLTVDTDSNSVKGTSQQNSSSSAPASGQTITVAGDTDQSASGQTTAQASSDHTTSISNGQTSGAGLPGQTTRAGIPGQTTQGGVPGQSTGTGLPGQTTGAGLPGQTTGASLPGQTTSAGLPGQTSGAAVPGQTTQAVVPGEPTGEGVPGQTTGAGIPGQTIGTGLPGQTVDDGFPGLITDDGLPGQTTGDNIGQNTGQTISEQNTGLTEPPPPYVTNSQTSGQIDDTSMPFSDNSSFTPGENMGGTSPNLEVSTAFPLTTMPTTTAGPVCPSGYVRTVILSMYNGGSDRLWLRGANIPLSHLPSTDPDYNRYAQGDTQLDWVGGESGQVDGAQGTPTLKNTDHPTSPNYVNTFDTNFWRTDACLDCSGIENNRFQFKMFDTNWETVSGGNNNCFNGGNHYAECGKINVFYFGSTNCQIEDFPDTIA